jgi:hypothetical protein
MFKQGKKPAFTISYSNHKKLIHALYDGEYFMDRLKLTRKNEIGAFRRCFKVKGERRQVHVQLVARISDSGKELIDVYAHTEPEDSAIIRHTISAFLDGASYQAGSRVLKKDLKEVGFKPFFYLSRS